MKWCNKCESNLELSMFSKKGDGLRSYCRDCAHKMKVQSKENQFTIEYIIERVKSNEFKGLLRSDIIKNNVIEHTSWLPITASFYQRLYHLREGHQTIENCINCKLMPMQFMDYKFDYTVFCGDACSKTYHKETRRRYKNRYYQENSEDLIKKNFEYQQNDPNHQAYQKKYYINHQEEIIAKASKHQKDNWTDRLIYMKEYSKMYRKKHPHIYAWRNTLRGALIRMNRKKEGHTIDILGYSAIELMEHITKQFTEGMSWDNYGLWHIDHIKGVITFDRDTPMDVVNALSNLRPLWAVDNLRRNRRY